MCASPLHCSKPCWCAAMPCFPQQEKPISQPAGRAAARRTQINEEGTCRARPTDVEDPAKAGSFSRLCRPRGRQNRPNDGARQSSRRPTGGARAPVAPHGASRREARPPSGARARGRVATASACSKAWPFAGARRGSASTPALALLVAGVIELRGRGGWPAFQHSSIVWRSNPVESALGPTRTSTSPASNKGCRSGPR
jgi:hypothetical protein